jgi:hypothetical protein
MAVLVDDFPDMAPLTGQSDLYHKAKAGRETRPIEGLAGDAVIWLKLATIDANQRETQKGSGQVSPPAQILQ